MTNEVFEDLTNTRARLVEAETKVENQRKRLQILEQSIQGLKAENKKLRDRRQTGASATTDPREAYGSGGGESGGGEGES